MRAKTNQTYYVVIYPNQEKITSDMTLHTPFILTRQHMRTTILGNGFFVCQTTENFKQGFHLLALVGISFQVLLILGRRNYLFHNSIDLSIFSTLERSIGFTSSAPFLYAICCPRASSMADRVVSLGTSQRITLRSIFSTKLFRLLLLAFAAIFIFSTSSAFNRKEVDTFTAVSILL